MQGVADWCAQLDINGVHIVVGVGLGMMVFMVTGNHWKLIFARCGLLVCSMGIIDVLILMRNNWCAQ